MECSTFTFGGVREAARGDVSPRFFVSSVLIQAGHSASRVGGKRFGGLGHYRHIVVSMSNGVQKLRDDGNWEKEKQV